MKSHNIIIAGNTSFIGNKLYNFLKFKYKKNKIFGFGSKQINLSKKNSIRKLRKKINNNTTFFFLSVIAKQSDGSIEDLNTNMKMIENFIRAINIRKPKKIIFFSSQAIYGEDTNNNSITENTLPNPTSYYGIAKYASEKLLSKVSKEKKISLLILRMPRIYGPGDNENYGPTQFCKKGIRNENIHIWGDGREKRDYVHIDDLMEIVDKLFKKNVDGEINICSGKPVNFKNILFYVQQNIKKKIKIIYKKRTRPKVNHIMRNDLLIKKIGKYKFKSLSQGIKTFL